MAQNLLPLEEDKGMPMQVPPASDFEGLSNFPVKKSLPKEIQDTDSVAVPERSKPPSYTSVAIHVSKPLEAAPSIEDPRNLRKVVEELKVAKEDSLTSLNIELQDSHKEFSDSLLLLEQDLVEDPQLFLSSIIQEHKDYYNRVESLPKTASSAMRNEDIFLLFEHVSSLPMPAETFYSMVFDKIKEMGGPLALLTNYHQHIENISDPYLKEGIRIVLREFLFKSLMPELMNRSPNKETAHQIITIYRIAAEHNVIWTARLVSLNEFHKKLNTVFPALIPYFHEMLPVVISMNGISLLMNDLKQKGSYSEEYLTCKGEDVFLETIMNLSNFKGGIFINLRGAHVTPLYLEAKEGVTKVFITDSLGISDKKQIESIVKLLRTAWPEVTIYCLAPQRQYDGICCPIFAIRDIVVLARNKEIWEFAEEKSYYNDSLQIQLINKTPLELEKVNQSMTALRQTPISTNFLKKYTVTVLDSLNVTKEQNSYATKRRGKYVSQIIAKVIEVSLDLRD